MLPKSFIKGKEVIKKIEQHNHTAYFVGGSVRDFILKRPIKDIDISTSASPAQIQQIFKKVIPVGIAHGTVIVRYDGESYEVTTFRINDELEDKYKQKFADDIHLDLARRDFTINALAMSIDGHVIDLFAGKKDIKSKIIRTVGNGQDRFKEDPLRLLRSIRFASQLGFTIEQQTIDHIKKMKDKLNTTAIERITNELEKIFAGNNVIKAVDYLIQTKLYEQLPLMKTHESLIYSLPQSLQPLSSIGEVLALFHYIDHSVDIPIWIKTWKCSNHIKKEAIQLSKALNYFIDYGLDKWLVYKLTPTYFNGFIRLVNSVDPHFNMSKKQIYALYHRLPIQSRRELAINGRDLIELYPNKKQGMWIERSLSKLENEVILHSLANNKTDLKNWLISHLNITN